MISVLITDGVHIPGRKFDMPYYDRKRLSSCFMALILLLLGCSTINPHENFRDSLYGAIGRSIDNVPSYLWPDEKALVSSRLLPNGNMENKYKHLRSCRYIFEIDPKTRRIVGARFEGSETDCVINP
jgi:hypothetical protein